VTAKWTQKHVGIIRGDDIKIVLGAIE